MVWGLYCMSHACCSHYFCILVHKHTNHFCLLNQTSLSLQMWRITLHYYWITAKPFNIMWDHQCLWKVLDGLIRVTLLVSIWGCCNVLSLSYNVYDTASMRNRFVSKLNSAVISDGHIAFWCFVAVWWCDGLMLWGLFACHMHTAPTTSAFWYVSMQITSVYWTKHL